MAAGGQTSSKAIIRGIRGEFIEGLQASENLATRVARAVQSDKREESYLFSGSTAQVRQWKDERRPAELSEFEVKVVNNHYEASLSIHRDDIDDDQVGFYMRRARELGTRMSDYENVLVLKTALDASYSDSDLGLSFDGQFHFDTDHAWTGEGAEYTTAQDNDLTAAAATDTTPTFAEAETAIDAMIEQFVTFKDDKGQPFHPQSRLERFVLLCPPDMVGPFQRVVESKTSPTGSAPIDNILQNKYDIVVNRYSANNDRVQMFAGDGAYILQRRLAVRTNQVTGRRSGELADSSFHGLIDYFGADLRANVGLAEPLYGCSYIFT
jgi:phage major head subunit gpT-like protein